MAQFDQVFRYNKTVSENDFYRQALIELASDKNTPEDILTARFGKILEEEKEYMSVCADIDVDYTVSIGYDEQEEVYNRSTQKYEKKTVTTWEPFSGHVSSEESCIMPTGENYDSDEMTGWGTFCYESELIEAVDTAKEDSIEVLENDPMVLNSECLEFAKDEMISKCFRGVEFPGDRHKDEKYTGKAKIKSIYGARVGLYKAEYTYADEKYQMQSFTCGNVKMFGNEMPSLASDTDKIASKKVLPFTISGLVLLLGGLLGLIVGSGIDMDNSIPVALGMFAAIIVGGIILWVGSKKKKAIINEANYLRKQAKLKKLMALLAEKKLPALTENEKALFNK